MKERRVKKVTLIKQQLNAVIPLRYKVKQSPRNKEDMNKELFVEVLKLLKEINDRSDFLSEEIGIDSVAYEDKFFRVIENLMRISFNKQQVFLVELYLNEIPNTTEDWDGLITVNVGKKEEKVAFRTPEDVWDAMQKFK